MTKYKARTERLGGLCHKLYCCNVCKLLEPKENNVNGPLFSLLNFVALWLTDDSYVSQSHKYHFKSIFIE